MRENPKNQKNCWKRRYRCGGLLENGVKKQDEEEMKRSSQKVSLKNETKSNSKNEKGVVVMKRRAIMMTI
eukprot:UN10313